MKISQNCIDEMSAIHKGKKQGIFSVEKESLQVLKVEEYDGNWKNFVSSFPEDKCCHIFTHFRYISETDNVQRSKFVHVLWAPSKASRKDKMQITFFAEKALADLGGMGACRIEAGSKESLEPAQVQERILRRVTVK